MTANDRIKEIMIEHGLTAKRVSELVYVSKHTVDAWKAKEGTDKRRDTPLWAVELLELKLEKKVGK